MIDGVVRSDVTIFLFWNKKIARRNYGVTKKCFRSKNG